MNVFWPHLGKTTCCTLSLNFYPIIHSSWRASRRRWILYFSCRQYSDFGGTSTVAQVFSQQELNGIRRELYFSKKAVELLASRQVEKILLQPGTKITYYRKREIDLLPFSRRRSFVFLFFVNDSQDLLMKMSTSKWRLFINISKQI